MRNTNKRHHPHTQGFMSKQYTTHRSKAGRSKAKKLKARQHSLSQLSKVIHNV